MAVGGLVAIFYFPINIGNFIIPIDFHIFQRGGPTTNQRIFVHQRDVSPTHRSSQRQFFQVRAWTVGDECRQKDDAKRDRLVIERFAAEHPRRVGAGLRDLDL